MRVGCVRFFVVIRFVAAPAVRLGLFDLLRYTVCCEFEH